VCCQPVRSCSQCCLEGLFIFVLASVLILHSLRVFLCSQSGLAFLVDQRPVLRTDIVIALVVTGCGFPVLFLSYRIKSSRFLSPNCFHAVVFEHAYKLFGQMHVSTSTEFWSDFCRQFRPCSCWHRFVFLIQFLARFRGPIACL
jgi:hypothetical protein